MRTYLLSTLLCTLTSCSLVGYEEQSVNSARTVDAGGNLGGNGSDGVGDGSVGPKNDTGSTRTDGGDSGGNQNGGNGDPSDDGATQSIDDGGGNPVGHQCRDNCSVACNLIEPKCALDCENSEQCTASCGGGGSCDANCIGSKRCDVTCPKGTTCIATCKNSDDCQVNCEKDSACLADCRGGNCTNVICAPGAVCELKCDKEDDCAFIGCANPRLCPDPDFRVVVCNQECP